MGLVKNVVNTVKNIGRDNVPKKKSRFKKHTPRPARGSVRRSRKNGGKLR